MAENDGTRTHANLRELCTWTLEATSLKGVPRILRSRTLFFKLLWVVAVLSLFSLVVLEVNFIVQEHFAYRVVLKQEEYSNADLVSAGREKSHFPAVTVCNLSPLRSDWKEGEPSIKKFRKKLEAIRKKLNSPDDETLFGLVNYMESRGYYQSLSIDDVKKMGNQQDIFILNCYFSTDPGYVKDKCENVAEIKTFTSEKYFNCYTLKPITQFQPSRLEIILFLDDFQNVSHHTFSKWDSSGEDLGAMINIHHENVMPEFSRAINIPAGFKVKINTREHIRDRLPAPHSDCVLETDAVIDAEGEYYDFTRDACVMACAHDIYFRACGCDDSGVLARWPRHHNRTQSEGFNFCGAPREDVNQTLANMVCIRETSGRVVDKCGGECRPPCKITEYESKTSFSKWPKTFKHLAFYKQFIRDKPYASRFRFYEDMLRLDEKGESVEALQKMSENGHLIHNNFVQIEIVLDKTTLVLSDQAKSTVTDVISKSGSILNLYSGITAILLVELLEFISQVVILIHRKYSKRSFNIQHSKATDVKVAL